MFSNQFPHTRMRRLRNSQKLRNLVKETQLQLNKFILPLFIRYGENVRKPINGMPGHYQLSLDNLAEEIQQISALGIQNIILFGIPEDKDPFGKDSYADNGIIQRAIALIKQINPTLLVITDVCFCEYTDHGHCGVLKPAQDDEVEVDNDATLALLGKQAVSHAQAGADMVAPSGSMDGMVGSIRNALDEAGYTHLPIMSYAVKYASSFYGPFRQAAEGAPQVGDRKTYQMQYANAQEAIRECALDIAEGADILMVKPAHSYLDIICRVKQQFPALPLCAYHTSGEYALLHAAAEQGWVNLEEAAFEVLSAIQRAGADLIVTYFAKDIVSWLR